MNKPRTSAEGSLVIPPMAKRQRLQRFADVIRSGPPALSTSLSTWNTAMLVSGNISRIRLRRSHSQRTMISCTPPA